MDTSFVAKSLQKTSYLKFKKVMGRILDFLYELREKRIKFFHEWFLNLVVTYG